MRWSRSLASVVVALASVAGPGAEPQQTPAPHQAPAPQIPPKPASVAPPLPAGSAPDLDLVFTAQVVGYVEPCG